MKTATSRFHGRNEGPLVRWQGCVPRPSVGLAVVASALGAAAALLVASTTGLGDSTTTVVAPASPCARRARLRRRPSTAAFDPQALYAARATGVVTIYANLGVDGGSQGSGFVVSRDGVILTNAHVITNAAEARTGVEGARAVYVEFSDGERVSAELSSAGISSATSASSGSRRRTTRSRSCRSAIPRASWWVSRSRRSEARSASRPRSRSASSRRSAARSTR